MQADDGGFPVASARCSPPHEQVRAPSAGQARALVRQFLPFLLVSFAFAALLSASEPLLVDSDREVRLATIAALG
ncbi:MAG TPA: hypothetical protein VF501_08570, partial [Thiobacillus sp.]